MHSHPGLLEGQPAASCLLSLWAGLLVLLSACGGGAPAERALPERVDFNLHVKPILSDRCFACHGPDQNKRKADLSLHTRDGIFAALDTTESRYAVVPGAPERSELIHRIRATDPDEMMPPPESNLSLSDYEVKLLARWVEQGADWKPHWAFIPPERPPVPEVRDASWPRDEVDRFILARLEQEGLRPSAEADRATLLRRVTFDLTGLPPTLEELDAFLADDSPEAYGRVVDRLLASEAYGEQMASRWLELARYADSHGYQDDFLRTMWPWRDWVIRAFNENMPYDQFVTWQLAGDLLPDPTFEQRLATGFNRNHPINQEAGIIPEEFRVEYVADRTNTLGTAFLGLTMECARCHDHKYDPISQEEYYRTFAFFNNVPGTEHEGGRRAPGPSVELPADEVEAHRSFLRERIEERQAEMQARRERPPPEFEAWQRDLAGRLPLRPSELREGLQVYLPLDHLAPDRQGRDAVVEGAGAGRAFRVTGGPAVVEGRYGGALEIVDDDAISLSGVGDFERDDAFTAAVWIYYPVRKRAPLITKRDGEGRGYGVFLNGEQIRVELGGGGGAVRLITKAGLRLNEWTHVAVTYDGSAAASGVKVYLNGERAGEVVVEDALRGSIRTRAPLVVGHPPGGEVRQTQIRIPVDEVHVYDRALAAAEVQSLARHDPLGDLLATPPEERSPAQARRLFVSYLYGYDAPFRESYRSLVHWQSKLDEYFTGDVRVMVMEEGEERRDTYVLDRGAYDAPTEPVSPGTPERILAFPESYPDDRLGLARWLFDERNPLTSRVAVNRYWAMLFGRGIVTTLDDFGNQGDLPSHPELLDWLAVTFRESGWDTKAMLRRIVMSATYRQSSDRDPERVRRDPENELLARAPRYRMPAEMVRDQALAASGLLVRKIGGPSVRPYQPAGLWAETTSGQGLTRYVNAVGEDLYRRSVYTFWKRTVPPPSMTTFDAAGRDRCTVDRQRTNTPLQALVLMNDPQMMEAARTLAERVVEEEAGTDARLARVFRVLTSRAPTEGELERLRAFYRAERADFEAAPERAGALLEVGDRRRDPSLEAPEVAALAMVASTVLNLDETITKE